jgi:hypothetical protein
MAGVTMVQRGKVLGSAKMVESKARVCCWNLMKLRINGVTIYRGN